MSAKEYGMLVPIFNLKWPELFWIRIYNQINLVHDVLKIDQETIFLCGQFFKQHFCRTTEWVGWIRIRIAGVHPRVVVRCRRYWGWWTRPRSWSWNCKRRSCGTSTSPVSGTFSKHLPAHQVGMHRISGLFGIRSNIRFFFFTLFYFPDIRPFWNPAWYPTINCSSLIMNFFRPFWLVALHSVLQDLTLKGVVHQCLFGNVVLGFRTWALSLLCLWLTGRLC